MASLEEFSAAEQIFNDPMSWRRESGKDWASERSSDDDSTPGSGPSDSLRGGRRKPKPPSFMLKPFNKRFDLQPVNERTSSNPSTPSSVYRSPLPSDSTPESPFDIEKIYGLDIEDIYGGDSDSPLVQSRSGWTGVADQEEVERSQILARLIESSKNISTEMSELVKQRMSILLGQGNIFRAFPTPHGFEFDFDGGDFITPDTGVATGGFARSSHGSLYSSTSDQIITRHSTRLSLKKGLRISTTRTTTTTTVISMDSSPDSPHSSVTIISAVSTTTPYSILDFYGVSPGKTGRAQKSPKTAGLLTSSSRPTYSSSQSLVPKTSHPTTTTFSTTSVPLPATGSRSAVATKFSLAQLTSIDTFPPNDTAKIVELSDDVASLAVSIAGKPPSLSIVTSVPSRLAYQKNAMIKEILPLAVTKKEAKQPKSSGLTSPRPLPRVPRAQTPPPPVPALPTSIAVPSVPELPSDPSGSSSSEPSKVSAPSTTGNCSAQISGPPPPPTRVDEAAPPKKTERGSDEKNSITGSREARPQNRTRMAKLRSTTPPPRGSRPPKKKPEPTPVVPPLPTETYDTTGADRTSQSSLSTFVPPLPPPPSLTQEVVVPSPANMTSSALLPQSSALSPPIVSPVSSSADTYPSPSLFPLPPAALLVNSTSQDETSSSTDVVVATVHHASDSSATEVAEDRVDARSSSGSSATAVEGPLDGPLDDKDDKDDSGKAGSTMDPPAICVSVDFSKDSPSTANIVPVITSTEDEAPVSVQVRDVPKTRTPSLIMSTTSVADLVDDAYAHGIPPVDENSSEVLLLRADSLKRREAECQDLSAKDDRSNTESLSTRPWTVRHVRSASHLTPDANQESLLRSDSSSSRMRSSSDATNVEAQSKRGKALRHSRSAAQLGSRMSDTRLGVLFEKDVPLPDRSLLAKRTRGAGFDGRSLVADAFVPGENVQPISGGDQNGASSWQATSEWDVKSTSAQNLSGPAPKPERPDRSHTPRIPSEVLTMRVSANSSQLAVASSSRPPSRSSSSSEKLLQSNPLPILAEKRESDHSPLVERLIGLAERVGFIPLDSSTPMPSLPVAAPPNRSLTPVSFGKLPMKPSSTNPRSHRRSVSEKLTQSTISSLAKRERRGVPTHVLPEMLPTRSASTDEPVPTLPGSIASISSTSVLEPSLDGSSDHDSSLRQQVRRAPTPTALQRRPMPSADTLPTKVAVRRAPTPTSSDRGAISSSDVPFPPLPRPGGTNSSRSTPAHSLKTSIDGHSGNEPGRRRAPTLPPSDRKRTPSDALPPVPSTVQRVHLQREEVRRAPTPTSLTRSRSGSMTSKDLPLPPVPSAPRVIPRSTPTHSPSASIDHSSDDRTRRAPTPSGTRPPLSSSEVPIPDASRRYRKPSISAASRAAHVVSSPVSSSSTTNGSESSARRFAQPTISSSAKLKPTSFEPAPSVSAKSGPPPLPPKSETRGRMMGRPESPMGGVRARSVPRKAREGGIFVVPPPMPPSRDEEMRRGRGRPSSPDGKRGRSSKSDADAREARTSLFARSRSVGPASPETVVGTRKRTSSLSVVPLPVSSNSLMPPTRSLLRAPSPSQNIVRGRMSPFPIASISPSTSSRPLSRALTTF